MSIIVRTPLLDPEQRILGYKLAWQAALEPLCASGLPDLTGLAAHLPRPPAGQGGGWTNGGLLFLEAPLGPLPLAGLGGLPAAATVIGLAAADFEDAATLESAQSLQAAGFGLSVRGLPGPELPPAWRGMVQHVELDRAQAADAAAWRAAGLPHLIASGLGSWEDVQATAVVGLDAFVEGTHSCAPRAEAALSPQSLLVLQLMQMVQGDMDLRHIETALRRDPALAYRLLRYLNSPSFGLGVEVQSLRHAVTMMGYRPLLRWLTVLLASSNATPPCPALMQAAVVRGRFAELLGRGMLPRHDAENLFVAGMFSLLDRLLGVPITDVLDRIQLPEAVVQALLGRQGLYGPFLRVVEECERATGSAAALGDAALLTSEQINVAHVAAIAWALDLRT